MMSIDTLRRLENTLRLGVISEISHDKQWIKIKSGEVETNWTPYPALIGNNFIAWIPLRVGTQVLFACVSGDLSQAIIITILYSNDLTPPSHDETTDIIAFNDGTTIKKNKEVLEIITPCEIIAESEKDILAKCENLTATVKNNLIAEVNNAAEVNCATATVSAKQSTTITSPRITLDGEVTITGDLTAQSRATISGNTTVNAALTVANNVLAADCTTTSGKSLNSHVHVGNMGAPTSPPA